VIGRDRRTRLLTLGTVAALLVAVVAFLALDTSDDGSDLPQDGYARAVDAACVQHKEEIAGAQRAALAGDGFAAVSHYADSIVPIAGEWRRELGRGTVPSNRAALVEALGSALLEVQIEAGTLARVARESNPREVAKVAAQMDAATANVEAAVDSLDLEHCGRLVINGGQIIRQ
jgi:predicted outer membrane protein